MIKPMVVAFRTWIPRIELLWEDMHRECHRLAPIGRTSIPAKSLDGQIADLSLEDDPLVEVESSKIVGTPIPI